MRSGPPADDVPEDRDDVSSGGPAELIAADIPDDIAELAADIEALYRERRAAARRRLWLRITAVPGRRAPATLMLSTLLLIIGSAALLVLLTPRTSKPGFAPSAPLAKPAIPPGKIGGLLPSATLREASGPGIATVDLLRPAGLVLVPAGCACGPAVQHALDATGELGLHAYVIFDAAVPPNTRYRAGVWSAPALSDPAGVLFASYAAGPLTRPAKVDSPTLLVTRADGVVVAQVVRLGSGTPLAGPLGLGLAP